MCVCGRLLIAASSSDLDIGLFMILTFPGLGLGGCKCPGIYPFFPGLLVYVHRVKQLFRVISEGSFYFCGIGGDIPFIIFYCIYLILLPFLFY